MHTYHPSYLEAEIRRIIVVGWPGQKFTRPHLNRKKLGMVAHTCHPNYSVKNEIGGSRSRWALAKNETLSQK
jgi:hypothetical protein